MRNYFVVYSDCQHSSAFCLSLNFCSLCLGQPDGHLLGNSRPLSFPLAMFNLCRLKCMYSFPVCCQGQELYRFLIIALLSIFLPKRVSERERLRVCFFLVNFHFTPRTLLIENANQLRLDIYWMVVTLNDLRIIVSGTFHDKTTSYPEIFLDSLEEHASVICLLWRFCYVHSIHFNQRWSGNRVRNAKPVFTFLQLLQFHSFKGKWASYL